ncbi:unknown [Prevotella sp. CAG:1185]|nr:unknown [Prevotella sp. CAG:1185]
MPKILCAFLFFAIFIYYDLSMNYRFVTFVLLSDKRVTINNDLSIQNSSIFSHRLFFHHRYRFDA